MHRLINTKRINFILSLLLLLIIYQNSLKITGYMCKTHYYSTENLGKSDLRPYDNVYNNLFYGAIM